MKCKDILKKSAYLFGCAGLLFGQSELVAADFSLQGFASVSGGTTGGTGGKVINITDVASLEATAAAITKDKTNPATIINIKGKLSHSGKPGLIIAIKRSENLTIQGDPQSGGELLNIGLNLVEMKNVIIQNLYIHEVLYSSDGLTIDNSSHIWVTRCEFHSKMGSGIGNDTYDGLLDIKKGSEYVTVSWCKLHDHMKCSLVSHSDDGNPDLDKNIKVTYHHNWFYNTNSRNPSVRFGMVHIYNNVYEDIGDYAVASRNGAHIVVENCTFKNVKLPLVTDKFLGNNQSEGNICESGNVFSGCGSNSITKKDCGPKIPYSYKPDPTSSLEALVKGNAGLPGKGAVVNNITPNFTPQVANFNVVSTKSTLQIESVSPISHVSIYSITGRLVSKNSINSQKVSLNISTLANGIYNVIVQTAVGITSKQIIK